MKPARHPETRLWRAVILQAILDYRLNSNDCRDEVSNAVRSTWFRFVCEMAQMEYAKVLKLFKRLEQRLSGTNKKLPYPRINR